MTDERNDDEVLGRALARAIETQTPRETPFEHSRIADRPASGGFRVRQLAGVVAALVLALAFGSWFTRLGETTPVAASPTAAVTNTPAATTTPSLSPSGIDHDRIFFARDGLPPISAHFATAVQPADVASRIRIRLTHLLSQTVAPPGGAFTAAPPASVFRDIGDINVAVTGDVIVDFILRSQDWGIHSAREATAFVQQLVYTASEEPGVRRVFITQDGGKPARIDQLVIDKPLSREDVFGYTTVGPVGISKAVTEGGPALSATDPNTGYTGFSTSTKGTSYRIAIDAIGADTRGSGSQTDRVAAFSVWMAEAEGELKQMGKYVLTVVVGATNAPTASTFVRETGVSDQTPVTGWVKRGLPGVAVWQIVLDDARPWRVLKQPADGRLVVEIGGDPRLVSDRIAVSEPVFDAKVGPSFVVSGSARVFEANVVWRVKDGARNVVASGRTTAMLGTSALWGSFQTTVSLPASVTVGKLTLEVYETSAKDGSEQGLVAVPLNR